MATKNRPGAYDCYANAEPDEPLFILLGRDPLAGPLVHVWAAVRDHRPTEALAWLSRAITAAHQKGRADPVKIAEAQRCANAMIAFANGKPYCRVCLCTDDDACLEPDGRPCGWAEPNLCTACKARESA